MNYILITLVNQSLFTQCQKHYLILCLRTKTNHIPISFTWNYQMLGHKKPQHVNMVMLAFSLKRHCALFILLLI